MWTMITIILLMVLSFALWVRMAPSDPKRWHVPLTFEADRDLGHGAMRVLTGQAQRLDEIDRIARATPRTTVLAGSVAEGRITYISRSKIWGFPDYTTVEAVDGDLRLFARQRFGTGDHGVNKARLETWLRAFEAG